MFLNFSHNTMKYISLINIHLFIKKCSLFLLLALILSCSESSNSLSNKYKIDTYITTLNAYYSSDNLISSTSYDQSNLIVKFEDNRMLEMETKLVTIQENNWFIKFIFYDNSTLDVGSVGSFLDFNYDKEEDSIVPLSRNFSVNIPYDGLINWKTHGINGQSSDINSENIIASSGENSFYIHGLYVDYPTDVTINYKNNNNHLRYSETFTLTSNEFINSINEIKTLVTTNNEPEYQRFILLAHRSGSGPLVLDQFGDIRYYLDKQPPLLDRPLYGLKQTSSGSLLWATVNTIFEYSLDGNMIVNSDIPEKYGAIHHDLVKFSANQYILTVNNNELSTIEDIVILYDVESESVVNEWDLNISIPKSDYFIGSDGFTQSFNDWFHVNAVDYVESDNTLLLSGQRSGVVKLSWDNELIWFLTDINRFKNESENIKEKILFNQFNEIITWGQHNIQYDEINDNYYLFDNGLGRYYAHQDLFSRGVKFKVNQNDLSYNILDTFGEDYPEYHSPIISGIDFNSKGNTLNLFGSIGYELTYTNNKDWLGSIWKDPQPEYGAAIQEYNSNGELILDIKISSIVNDDSHRFYNKDIGIYRASYFEFNK